MTVGGWILFGLISIFILVFAICLAVVSAKKWQAVAFVVGGIIVVGLIFGGLWWYFHGTAAGQRRLIDSKSNLQNGIERVINVYTADGDLIASYNGRIDIEDADGGFVKFDFDGKRYIYYNCFVETIAELATE